MASVTFQDEILAPSGELLINYTGKEPFRAMAITPKMLRDVMKIPGKDLFELDIRWDTSSDPRGFYGVWLGRRTEDRWTETKLKIIVQGEQKVADRTGSCEIHIRGHLVTSYDFNNFIQRSFWWFYNKGFYYQQRRRYLEFAKDNMQEIKENYLRLLEIQRD